MEKVIVFISHIAEEAAIAQSLKRLLEKSFLGIVDVFVSSDAKSIPLGQKWLDHITGALRACKVEIVIASPISIKRSWISFEAGAGWVREIPVIPLCHSGMVPAALPKPMNDLQGAIATDKTKLAEIVPVLAEAIGCNEPAVDWDPFIATIQDYESQFKKESEEIAELENKAIGSSDGLIHSELDTLLFIGENSDDQGRSPVWQVMNGIEQAGYKKIVAKLGIASLIRKGLIASCVSTNGYGDDSAAVEITPDGWGWIETNRERLELDKKKEQLPSKEHAGDDGSIPF